jgi:photosystem II stability/assembly factor-like uncharacterized protein
MFTEGNIMQSKKWLAPTLAVMSMSLHAGPGSWTLPGPSGGTVTKVAVSAADANRVYVTSTAAIFRSIDAGLSYARLAPNQDLGFVSSIAVSSINANHIFLVGSRVRKSTDGGGTWSDINVPSGTSEPIAPVDVAYAPGSLDTVFLATNSHGLFKTNNGGVTWTRLASATLPARLGRLAVDPSNANRLVVSPCVSDLPSYTGPAVFVSTDSGTSFTGSTITGTPPANYGACAFAAAFSPVTPGLLLIQDGIQVTIAGTGLLRSTDGGVSFSYAASIARPRNFQFVSATTLLAGNSLGGLLQSTDAGMTFSNASSSPSYPASASALEAFEVALKPGDTSVRYAATTGGVFRSSDSGATWSARNDGIRATNIRSLAVNPLPANSTVYAGSSDLEGQSWPFYRSADAGNSFIQAGTNFEVDWFRALLLDSNTAGSANPVLYAGGRDNAPNRSILLRASPVVKSIDGGTTWSTLNNFVGLQTPPATNPSQAVWRLGTVRNIVADRSVVTGGVWSKLYLSASGSPGSCLAVGTAPALIIPRLWRTLNGGASWDTVATPGTGSAPGSDGLPTGECVDIGPPGSPALILNYPTPNPIVVDPVDANIIYVGTFMSSYSSPASGFTPNALNGVFRSTDGGVTWSHRSTGLPRYAGSTNSALGVLAMAMDPSNRNILYAAVNPFDSSDGVGNIYKTIDGGANWTVTGSGLAGQDIRAILIDPSNSLRVFAASGGNALNPGAVFVTENGGGSWNSISAGLPTGSATSLAIKDQTLFAGTRFGVAQFTRVPDGDFDGPSNDLENTAPSGDGNGDGTQDANQSNVASIQLASRSFEISSGGAQRFTIEVTPLPNGGSCNQLYDVTQVPPGSFGLDAAFDRKPLGEFRFEISNCASARVRMIFADDVLPRSTQIRVYGPQVQGDPNSFAWSTLLSSMSLDRKLITFTINDNQLGDARQDSNRILFQGGPASELFSDGFE